MTDAEWREQWPEDCRNNVRLLNALHSLKIVYARDLLHITPGTVWRLKGIGRKTFSIVRRLVEIEATKFVGRWRDSDSEWAID